MVARSNKRCREIYGRIQLVSENKEQDRRSSRKVELSEVPEKPWTHLIVDFIMKLSVVAGKDAILVVRDRLSKMTYFMATTEETLVEGLVRLFRDNIWKLYGLPESIVSDRGPQFATELMKELNKMLGIETRLSTAFHPQTDGADRTNKPRVGTVLEVLCGL